MDTHPQSVSTTRSFKNNILRQFRFQNTAFNTQFSEKQAAHAKKEKEKFCVINKEQFFEFKQILGVELFSQWIVYKRT